MIKETCKLSVLTVAALTILSAGMASAQQKYQYNYSTPPQSSRYVRQHVIDVGDIPGHQIRIFEVQRVYTRDNPAVMGTKVVETWSRGSSDYIHGVGPAQSYEIWVLEDGSKIFGESRGTSHTEATATGSPRRTFHGTTRFFGGTGKFTSIRGVITTVTEFDADPKTGYNRPVTRGEYWLEK